MPSPPTRRRTLPAAAALFGLGWTGSIRALELCRAGLDVVAIERGPWRDTPTGFPTNTAPDERRHSIRHDIFPRPAQETLTFRNTRAENALPIRKMGSFLLGNGVGGSGLHWNGQTWRFLPWDFRARGPQADAARHAALGQCLKGGDGGRLQPNRHGGRAGLLGAGCDPRPIPEEPRPAGAGVMRRLVFTLLLAAPRAFADSADVTSILNGRYLATVGDCIACQTGPAGQYAGGRGIETPFVPINAPHLTSDADTGIGSWTEADFARAMHDGQRPDGSRLHPAFPYPWYTKVSGRDVADIYAFLRTIMRGWNLLFFTPGRFAPRDDRSDEWNRGACLVEGLGHCGACHTARNALGGDSSATYQGGPLQGWFAPNLTGDARQGVGNWSVAEIIEYLRTGATARSRASGPMAEVVGYSTSLMTEPDLRAIAVYHKDQPARVPAPPPALAAADPAMRAGEALYIDNRMACHRRDGQGVAGLFPALAVSQVVQQPGADTLLRIVAGGVRALATDETPTGPGMPASGWRPEDPQIADVVPFIRNSWGNQAPAATTGEAARPARRRAALNPGICA